MLRLQVHSHKRVGPRVNANSAATFILNALLGCDLPRFRLRVHYVDRAPLKHICNAKRLTQRQVAAAKLASQRTFLSGIL